MTHSNQQTTNLSLPIGTRAPALTFDLSELRLLRQTLNLVDYGLVVVDADSGAVNFANAQGQSALQAQAPGDTPSARPCHGLRVLHGRVIGYRPADTEQFRRALERTKSGLRDFLSLGEAGQAAAVAVLPLGTQNPAGDKQAHPSLGSAVPEHYALLVFAKQHLCDDSTMALFARERGLTSAEGQVLSQVCKGLRPAQIASNHGVRISTVRTQLRSIRLKTCSDTIRELVQKVSVLPPMARQLPGQLQM
ncbi:MAG: helix-turn-helix transcriptional regulator [Rhodoferax sp.]|jgi:DNA-binding CsgD family transcriptional regulator|nr:helix-turn-helix transcriptional regulator [Rhodoferax sp.]MBP9930813.1 helix-turn-helix transcriptional regulator [Rhodoferax sp.]HQX59308.1 helix-turn-helix transcriptional regulator [Burkholderiaceae bacterium]HQZ07342.1 helix-turn-helix transcriptional regulator [Burkholderiaceae bacterium]HRA61787.1 helix-turn-helix transcriptional regulator [Burkholderiaceae bacterium]